MINIEMSFHRIAFTAALLLVVGAGPPIGQLDDETRRYQAELGQLGIAGSMFDIQSRAFNGATANKRIQMWADLERLREVLATDEMKELLEIRRQSESTPVYDAESLSYKAALEKAGKSPEEVNGLLSLFSMSQPRVRKVLWDDLGVQQP
jgi:hypothetical protein